MKIIKHLARILVGITFIFSGFVKGIDPLGSQYKFTDYFNAMGLEWLIWSSFLLGVLLAFIEYAIGVALLCNIKTKLFAWPALLFMIFFTGLTLWIALENPVTDCGCFGDALVISNWGTFYKNVVLIILTIIIFKYRFTFKPLINSDIKYGIIFGSILGILYIIITVYSYNHLPVLDFRPYKIGVNIPEAMSYPDDAPEEIYENIFYYKNKNTGRVEKFTEDNYPWQDTVNWEYENLESKLIQKGYEPPIHDLIFETRDGDDIIDFFIYDENYVFILIAYDLEESNLKSIDKINTLADWAFDNNMQFIGLTSTLFEYSDVFLVNTGGSYEFFNCDEITLKTIIRSNPGLIVIKNGDILGKWHYNDIPTPEEFSNKFLN